MMQAEPQSLIPPLLLFLALGAVLGLAYFGLLWLSVKRLPRLARPRLFLLSGFGLRLLGAALVIGLCAREGMLPLAACLCGFLIVRTGLAIHFRPGLGSGS